MHVTLRYSKYSSKTWTVKGKTIEELFKNLEKHKWWGRFRSNTSYSAKEKDDVVTDFSFKGTPVIIMPKWSHYSKASKEEKKSWNNMWKVLEKHEKHHYEIFDEGARAWRRKMERIGDLDGKQAKNEWKDYLKTAQAEQDKYDTKTNHGIKEGVILQNV